MRTKTMVFAVVMTVIVGIFGLCALLAVQHQYDVMMNVLGGVGAALMVLAFIGPVVYVLR